MVISEKVFSKLDPSLQKLIVEGGKVAQQAVLEYQIKEAEAAKKAIMEKGVKISQLEDEEEWKKAALEKVWPAMIDFVGGKEAVNKYLKAINKPEI